ncbi:Serine/arginine repetitive matrix protein 2 isoform 1 [Dorcoceras hygrometricum]|uniref:Serine/arginine repetitive matrix protein 2 isoform 1 n=1 Tax=Dorcoceras hygrometricum TaxID=472368 RepID=A0A2Z7ALE3_9LAMI|nr:Serine/arginine repetitive matrix protein 2 isoform 1 [Dorcoceras hygrometricum]
MGNDVIHRQMIMGSRNEQIMEKKQMGCMAGFFQIFDRHRVSSTKRLPCTPAVGTISEPEISVPVSPAITREFIMPSPEPDEQRWAPEVVELPPKSPLLLPIFNLKEGSKSSWKFNKEAPRLSLDSRATTDAKGGLHPKRIRTSASTLSTASRCDSLGSDTSDGCQNRSPSVIARLMGLEPLPNSSDSETEKKPELRRSASESRASRDLFHSRFVTEKPSESLFLNTTMAADYADPRDHLLKNAGKAELSKASNRDKFNSLSPWKAQHRKSFFDIGDIFPETNHTVPVHGEMGKRLKVRGIDEPSKDLETLKQILEALQLKGLLHSKNPNQDSHRIFIYDESPIVVMQPPSTNSSRVRRRNAIDYARPNGIIQARSIRRNHGVSGENYQSIGPRRDRNMRTPTRGGESPTRTEFNQRSNSIVKPKPLSIETQRKLKNPADNRRVSPINSPKLNTRRTSSDPTAKINKNEKIPTVGTEEGESSSISGSSITTSTDTERWKSMECKEGRNLLERCDKLLHSIAEMNSSPVSVLDSSLYKDELFTPSPVTARRNLDFKDESGELEDEIWSPMASSTRSKWQEETRGDCDFIYISDILRASDSVSEDSDIFLLLEKQQFLKGKDTSKASRLQRKLIFDATNEIIERNRRLPPWKTVSWTNYNGTKPLLDDVWSEFLRIRSRDSAEDLFEVICGVLKKDLAGDEYTGWGGDHPTEKSEAVLDIERLIFKDLVNGMIQDLAALAQYRISRRKLVF